MTMHRFQPMPVDENDQQRVHGTVPKEVYRRFRNQFPQHGSIQWAIRLAMEILPKLPDKDEAYKRIFQNEMEQMYADDKLLRETENRLPMPDPRQLDLLGEFKARMEGTE